MKAKKEIGPFRHFFAAAAAVLLFANAALAGPPLVCHVFEIGHAKSLPLASHSWNLSGSENYDTKNLVKDTLDILARQTPVLVRMETLRRATLYARKDPIAAKELLAKLYSRASSAESAGHADALAWFDAGYVVETYKQWIGRDLPHMTDGMPMDANPAAGVDGYAMVKKAMIAPLRERIFVGRPASANVRSTYVSPDTGVMRRLQVAFVRETIVRADYVKETGESSSRRVEPHAMLINWPAWYLLGFDHLRGEPRTFRFDRFRNVEVEEQSVFRARPREIAGKLLSEHCVPMDPV